MSEIHNKRIGPKFGFNEILRIIVYLVPLILIIVSAIAGYIIGRGT